jgi:two-component system, OmpR family, sensor kinase
VRDWRPSRWPLFSQFFAILLATVMAVQLLNTALLLFMPTPTAEVHSLKRIATALRNGTDSGELYRLRYWTRLPPGPLTQHDLDLANRFARLLGVPATRVRVRTEGRFAPEIGKAFERATPSDPPDTVFGPLILAVLLPDGRWHSIQPITGWWQPWRLQVMAWLVATLVAISLPAWLLTRRLMLPIRSFSRAADRLGRNPEAEPLSLTGPVELEVAAAAFNAMQTQIKRYVADRTTMIAAIAHDLRTPLMRMSMLLDHIPAQNRAALEAPINEMDARLTAVMSLVQNMTCPASRQRVDLRSIAQSVADDAEDTGGVATLIDGPTVIMKGDPAALKAMIFNLVENANRYAGEAIIELLEQEKFVVVEVRDNGPGLEPDELEQVFQPFYRGEGSRSSETGGIGLGLASVKAICRAHGGDAQLVIRQTGGLVARVTLARPIAE